MWPPPARNKKKKHLHTYPAGAKRGAAWPRSVASLSPQARRASFDPTEPSGSVRCAQSGRGSAWLAQSEGGVLWRCTESVRLIPTPSRFVAIRGVLAGFCGDVATPSRTPSPAPSQTCVSLSPSAQTRSVHVVSHVHRVVLHVPHRVGHPKTPHHAPIGTLYRYILSQI